MENAELIAQLQKLPLDARVDIVFPDADAYGVTGADAAVIGGGETVICLFAEADTVPGPAVA